MAEYIDRKTLITYTEKQRIVIKDGTSVAEAMRIQGKSFRRCVEEAPAADVVEVKHGKWEKISGFDVCNICGTSPAYWEPEPNNPKGYPPYCHDCGAKMDGGDE